VESMFMVAMAFVITGAIGCVILAEITTEAEA
jgi:hypothetical protein